ncbi:MAG: tryptophan synthase subunit alpha [Candidatus Omnitrophota bacterium]|jgi:tryptophan synthase alpha chain
MNRIEKKFKKLKAGRKKAFVVFITAGYPSLKTTEKLIMEFAKIGVDIIELGVPFSDPMADGAVIQQSSEAALKKNVHLVDILRLVKRVRRYTNIPICLMTYYNPVFCFGEEKFIGSALAAGVDGVIIPDLPPEEGRPFIRLANQRKLDVICFISPTTSDKRLRQILAVSKGFIYYVSLTGVTGPRKALPADLVSRLKMIKKLSPKPVCVGFGVSLPAQVRRIYKIADGVIVGSAIVKKIKENIGKPDLIKKVSSFVSRLKAS